MASSVPAMTTHWNNRPNEVTLSTPDYLHTAKAIWPFPHANAMPRPDGLAIARAALHGEALFAPPEIQPDYSHCGINE